MSDYKNRGTYYVVWKNPADLRKGTLRTCNDRNCATVTYPSENTKQKSELVSIPKKADSGKKYLRAWKR